MPKHSVAAWPIPGSTARLASRAAALAFLLAATGRSYGAVGGELLALEQHAQFDRLVVTVPEGAGPLPLIRLADGRYRLVLPQSVAHLPASPRGLSQFAVEKATDGLRRKLELVPGEGTYIRFLAVQGGYAIDIVHDIGALPGLAAIAPAAAPTGPLPPKTATLGVLFSAPRLAAFRIGDELVLVLSANSDLDPSAIPPGRVLAVSVAEQGRYRILRLKLRSDTPIDLARDGGRQWRLGFGQEGSFAAPDLRFVAGGRSAVFGTLDVDPEIATLTFPEYGTVAVLLTSRNWSVGPARSPYLELLGALIGGVVLPRTDGLSIERHGERLTVSGIDRRIGG